MVFVYVPCSVNQSYTVKPFSLLSCEFHEYGYKYIVYQLTNAHCTYIQRYIEAAFHIRLTNSCNVLGTAEPATIT